MYGGHDCYKISFRNLPDSSRVGFRDNEKMTVIDRIDIHKTKHSVIFIDLH